MTPPWIGRVLIVTGIFPPDVGGPATYVPSVAARLAAGGHSVTVLTLSDDPAARDAASPYRVVRLRRQTQKLWRWALTIAAVVKEGRSADVLFVNGLACESALANLLLRKPLVLKVVGDLAWERAVASGRVSETFEQFQGARHGAAIEVLKRLRSWWTRRANTVVVPSEYLRGCVRGWGVPDERIVVIYNAVEPGGGERSEPLPLQTPFKVVVVGRLVPWKRVDAVVDAIRDLSCVGLVIVGDGPERGRLESEVERLGMRDRVYFAGATSTARAAALMAACDVFVLGSTYEGLPHTLLEAMALGLPVVATAVGGVPEVVRNGDDGVLIDFEPQSLREALARLFADPGLRGRLGRGAQMSVTTRFSMDAMLAQTEQALAAAARREWQ